MAVINKLRNSGFVLIAIIFALAAFIIGEFISSYQKKGAAIEENSVGSIDGENIQTGEFDAYYKQYEQNLVKNQGGEPLNESQKNQISQSVWDKIFSERVFNTELDKLGLIVSEDEKKDLIFSTNPHPNMEYYFSPLFKDGKSYDPNQVRQTLMQMKSNPEAWNSFGEFTDAMVADVKNKKYSALIKQSIYVTKLETDYKAQETNTMYDGKLVALRELVNKTLDSIQVSDSELEDYLRKHEKDLEQDKSVDFQYLRWEIKPTKADSLSSLNAIQEKYTDFKNTTNDSVYLGFNASTRVDTSFTLLSALPKAIGENLESASVGSMYGPVLVDGEYKVYKVLELADDSLTYYNSSNIKIAIQAGQKPETFKQKAEDLLRDIKNGTITWAQAVKQSDDRNSSLYGGYNGWDKENTVGKEYLDYIKKYGKGHMGIVEADNGYHIVRIDQNPSRKKVRYGVISESITPSRATNEAMQRIAQNFRNSITEGLAGFEKQAEKNNLFPSKADKVDERTKSIPGVTEGKPLTDWLFDAKREDGDISPVLSNKRYFFVLAVSKVRKAGVPELDDIRDELMAKVRIEKKNDMLFKQMQEAAKDAKSIEEVAINLKTIAMDMKGVSIAQRNIENVGNDGKLLGSIAGAEKDKLYTVKGSQGAYAYIITNVEKPEDKEPEKTREMFADQLSRDAKMAASQWGQSCLKKLKNVKDNRYKYNN